MGHIKHIESNLDPQAFPGATYIIQGDVPASQCSEAKLEGIIGATAPAGDTLTEPNAFTGFALAGKKITITSPPSNVATFNIIGNSDNTVTIDDDLFSASIANIWYCHDGGELILTRNAESFLRFFQTFNTLIDIPGCDVTFGFKTIHKVGGFPDNYAGLQVTLLGIPPPYFGPHLITFNTIDFLETDFEFDITEGDLTARITDPNVAAATIKGGVLYTSMPTERIRQACTILFNPLS